VYTWKSFSEILSLKVRLKLWREKNERELLKMCKYMVAYHICEIYVSIFHDEIEYHLKGIISIVILGSF
jgi:hypothetical protein